LGSFFRLVSRPARAIGFVFSFGSFGAAFPQAGPLFGAGLQQ
jgi:hypothetical protein